MESVVGPVANGVQGIVEINPWAGVLIGGLLLAIGYFVVENRALRKEARAKDDWILADKEKQLAEAKRDRELYERLADEAAKRRRS